MPSDAAQKIRSEANTARASATFVNEAARSRLLRRAKRLESQASKLEAAEKKRSAKRP